MAETPPEPLWPGEAVDELPTADGLPHQERTRGRRGRLESVRLEEAPSLEPVQAETPKDDDPDGRQEGEDIHHARLQTNRSEEHTSELQSRLHLVCRLLLEKKKKTNNIM